jgi:hypothetical protein
VALQARDTFLGIDFCDSPLDALDIGGDEVLYHRKGGEVGYKGAGGGKGIDKNMMLPKGIS